jgi:hypothetical protein
MEQPIRVVVLEIAFDPFGAELALVKWEFQPRLHADDGIVLDLELETALLAAEAAVGLDQGIRLDAGIQPNALGIGWVGSKLVDNLAHIDRYNRHHSLLHTGHSLNRVELRMKILGVLLP